MQEPPLDPPAAVRESCAWVASQASSVAIHAPSLAAFAAELLGAASPPPPPFAEWHYTDDVPAGGELTARYCLALDALNFCFWPSPEPLEYDALALGLRARLRADARALDAGALAAVTAAGLAEGWTAPPLPNAPARAASLAELGRGLQQHYGGSALALVRAAAGSAPALVRLLLLHFPCFNDVASYTSASTGETRVVHFYKRAQICVGDLWAAFGGGSVGGGGGGGGALPPADFADVHCLTAFADYRLPQLLRDRGVLVYAPALAAAVDAQQELPAGGAWEVEIRAATVEAVERIRGVGRGGGAGAGAGALSSVELDWRLWNAGEALQKAGQLRPHHRTRSTFY